jgi:HK97 family phage major capsid protein
LEELQRKAMSSQSDPDGGYLIEETMDAIIDRVVPTISAMYRMANVVTIGTPRYEKLVKTSGMAMRRIAEGGAGGESTAPKYAKVTIDVATAEVEPWVYNETLDDAFIDLESDLANEAAIGFAAGAGSEFITGNGVGCARGITAHTNIANASYAWGSVGYILSKKSAAFASVSPSDQIIALQHALKAQYRPGAAWMMNDTTLGVLRQMKDSSGNFYLWQPDPLGSFGGRLLGNPVEVDDNFADLGANSFSLAFGNYRQAYTIVNRAGTTLIRDNITAKGTTKFNFRRRFGGGITNFEAVKLMKFASTG